MVAAMKLDVLVTHEAPATTHRYGFVAIDELARRTRAGLVVHGHHHRSSDMVSGDGVRVVGLKKAEVFTVDDLTAAR